LNQLFTLQISKNNEIEVYLEKGDEINSTDKRVETKFMTV